MRKQLAIFLLAIAAVAVSAFAMTEGRMTGKVTDAVTKQGIPNATITIVSSGARNFKADFKTEKDGAYRLIVIDATLPYTVTFSAQGYQPYQEQMKLKLGEVTTKDVALTPAAAAAATVPAAEGKPDPAVTAYNAGAQAYNSGDFTGAAAKFREAVTAKPDLTAGWQALARTAIQLKDYPTAIEAANKSLAVDSDDPEMYSVLYTAYTATGDTAKAAEAKKKMPANASSLFNDAAKLINSGKDADAEPLLKQAVAVDDKFSQAYYELGMLQVRTGKNADAKVNLQKYIELEPNGKDVSTAKEMLKYL
ncbi:MAG TPA: carboxypeptidase regulatory-like domain-containing protein, partial [Thermoanaerobaculia bacterium]|nr:carboxypeptidase regulatory-like domain-containing protein [Thermoanaerobaculia bacterium]